MPAGTQLGWACTPGPGPEEALLACGGLQLWLGRHALEKKSKARWKEGVVLNRHACSNDTWAAVLAGSTRAALVLCVHVYVLAGWGVGCGLGVGVGLWGVRTCCCTSGGRMWWSPSAPPAASASTPASADSHWGPACEPAGEQLFLLPPSLSFGPLLHFLCPSFAACSHLARGRW